LTIEDDTMIRRNPRAEFRSLGEEEGGVVLHLDTAAYHGLNGVGVVVWGFLDGITFGDLMARLRQEFVDAPDSLDQEIEGFIGALAERDLVLIGDAAAEPEPQ
jgi:hypothetical protein